MINYFTTKEKTTPIKITKEVELVKLKLEIMLIGKHKEVEIYTEFETAENEHEDKNEVLSNLFRRFYSQKWLLLPFNDKCISTDYYDLVKADIKNVTKVKKAVECYEFKKTTHN